MMELNIAESPLVANQVLDKAERALGKDWQWLTDITIAGNEIWRVLTLFATLLIAMIVGRLVRWTLRAASRRFEQRNRPLLSVACEALASSIGYLAFVVGIRGGLQFLSLNATVETIADTTTSVLVTIGLGYMAYCLVAVVDRWLNMIAHARDSKLDDMLVPLVRASLRVTIVVLVLVQIATILSDKPLTSVVAGLGVGGLAVGLAAQDTIKNFFGSLMIFSDRPFELGDDVRIDNLAGTVEVVGFRSTRLRTGDGFLVSIPNGDLANRAIVNVSRRRNIFRNINLGLGYDLSPEKLRRATAIVCEILTDHAGSRPELPPRVFLNELTDNGVNLTIQYWYHPPDWWQYMAFNEQLNLEIVRRFQAEQITIAYRTQTIHLAAGEPPRSEPSPSEPQGLAGC